MPYLKDEIHWTDENGKETSRGMTTKEVLDLRIESIQLASATLPDRSKSPKAIFQTASFIYEYILTGKVASFEKTNGAHTTEDVDE